jgi:hypothetical protein
MRLASYGSEVHYCDHLSAITQELRNRGVEVEHHHGYANRRAVTDRTVLVASRKDAGFLSDRNVILVEHGAGQRYNRDAGSGGADHEDRHVVLFLAPSERVAENGKPLYPRAKRLAVGSPRVEQLSLLPKEPEYVVMAWHWNAPGVPEAKGAWERYKVGAKDLASKYPVLGHGHPRTKSSIGRDYKQFGISQEWDWAECVKQAKALTCDNSSVMWEAVALDIPVVVINAPWYRKEVEWGLRFWECADVGPQVDSPADLAEAVRLVLEEDQWKARRAEVTEALYGEVEGSTRRAVDAIMELIG